MFALLLVVMVVAAASTSNCSSAGLHMSVWKSHYDAKLNSWIENNVVNAIREQEKSIRQDSLVSNNIQPQETNVYMSFAEAMVKEKNLDLFDVDIVYPGRFQEYTSDLNTFPELSEIRAWLDQDLLEAYSSSDGKRLLAFPWFKEHGILLWRKDLLLKYNYDENEPLKNDFTWDRMEAIAKDIVNKESKVEEGYAWQGNHYEGLTCNVMEWLASDGITSRIIDGDKITLDIDESIPSFDRVRRWLSSSMTRSDVLSANEITVKKKFEAGEVVFARLWSGMYDGVVKTVGATNPTWKIGVSFLPKGKYGKKAATLGGWGITMSKFDGTNLCRKQNSLQALKWMVNMSAQKYFYQQFQRGPTFNRTFIDNLCRNLTTFQVVCELNRQAAISKVKLISRPDVFWIRTDIEVIYHFVNTLYMKLNDMAV